MTHLERLFAALWLSEGWYEGWYCGWELKPSRRIAWKARGIVLYDRVLTGRIAP